MWRRHFRPGVLQKLLLSDMVRNEEPISNGKAVVCSRKRLQVEFVCQRHQVGSVTESYVIPSDVVASR